ncbi:MAG: Ig-like domain-containing protein [Candidatus Saccharimonadales bacterium]
MRLFDGRLYKRVSLFALAIILAVSSISAAAPFFFSENAYAAPVDVPSNLRLNGTLACGYATNVNSITPTWDAVSGAISYNYKVVLPGGGIFGPINVGNVTSVTGPFGAEGLSTFSVQAVDINGITSDWATPCAVTYDATNPAAPVNGQPLSSTTNDFYFTWDAVADSGSSIAEYQFQSAGSGALDGSGSLIGAWKNWVNFGVPEQQTLTTPTIHSVGAGDGLYYWQVRAIDAAGNVGPWSSVWSLTLDSKAPVAPTLVSPVNGSIMKGTTVTQSWSTVDTDIDHYIYESYNDSSATSLRWHEEFSATSKTANNVADASYWWRVKAVDHLGNVGPWSELWNLTIDNTTPTANLVFPTPGSSSTSFTVNFSEAVNATDATNPANYFLDNWPGAGSSGDLVDDATITYDAEDYTAIVTFTRSGWYISAEQNWGVQNIYDLAGNAINQNPTTKHSTEMVNPNAPGVPTTTTPTNASSINWSWTAATDPGGVNASGVKGYYYKLTQGATNVIDWTFTTATAATTVITVDGTYTLHVYTIDNAGNVSLESTGDVVIDTEAPVVPAAVFTAKHGSNNLVGGITYTNSVDFIFNLTSSSDVTRYQLKYWNDISGSVYKETTPWNPTNLSGYSTSLGVYNDLFTQGEGVHHFVFSACDAAGNCSAYSDPSFVVEYDKTAPNAAVDYDITAWTNGSVIATLNPSESVNITNNAGATYTFTSNGTFTFEFADAAGNTGTALANVNNIDKTKPSKPVLEYPIDGIAINNNAPLMQWQDSTDADSGILGYDYRVRYDCSDSSNIPASCASAFNHSTTNSEYQAGPTLNGTYYWRVRSKDNAGNVSAWSEFEKITIDTVSPLVTISSPMDLAHVSGDMTLNGSVTDLNPAFYRWTIKNSDGSTVYSHRYHQDSVVPYIWDTTTQPDGNYNVYLKARDEADNITTVSVRITIDNTAPTGIANSYPTDGTKTTTADLTYIDWTDAIDGSDSNPVVYYYESSTSAALNADDSFLSPVYQSTALTSSEIPASGTTIEGTYYWHVRAVDSIGNDTGWTSAWTIIVDNTAPIITVTGGDITIEAGDAYDEKGATWTDTVDGLGDVTDITGTVDVLVPGDYTITYSVTDTAGNNATATRTVTVEDTTKPVVVLDPITSPNGGLTDSVNISGSVSDIVGVVGYEIAIDGVVVSSGANDTVVPYVWDISGLANGTYTVTLTATDAAGNTNSATQDVDIDNTAPVITYTDTIQDDNIFTPDIAASDYDVFAWAGDASNPAGVIYDNTLLKPTFTVANDGTYKFTLTATDGLGNSSNQEISFEYTAPVSTITPTPATIAPQSTSSTDGSSADNSGDSSSVPEVFGDSTTKTDNSSASNNSDVKGDSTTKDNTWAILGLAWYWWLLILAALGGTGWWLLAGAKKDGEE